MKPIVHAQISAKKFGGKTEDYIKIHNMMDSSKSSFPDNRHRAIFHNSLGPFIMEKMFGVDYTFLNEIKEKYNMSDDMIDDILKLLDKSRSEDNTTIVNSDGKHVSIRDIAEQHILEDFHMKFIPTISDYLSEMEYKDWMQNGILGTPTSVERIERKRKEKQLKIENTLSD